jgi:branched-subunit amino acid aminotransferase/4-amino-4-deoxychorismate lyase
MTPGLERSGIEGVLRAVVLREAKRTGVAVRITYMAMSAIPRSGSPTLSNARLGLLPVHQLDERVLLRSERLHELAARIESLNE